MSVSCTLRTAEAATDRCRPCPGLQELIAYSGQYRLEPPNRFVTTADVAWFQPWLENEQARSFELNGDVLNIVSDPSTTPLTGDAQVVGVLSWRRGTDQEK
jgi:Lipocalin-like domain